VRSPFPSPLRFWFEDLLLRRPSPVPLPPSPALVILATRQPAGVEPLPAWDLFRWLAGGVSPLLFPVSGRWLEFHRPLDSLRALGPLLWVLGCWLPRLIRRDLSPRVRSTDSGHLVVLRDWGELGLPLVRDYFGLRLAVRFHFPRADSLFLSLLRLRP